MKKNFFDKMKYIAIPITIQSLFQAILSLIDEVMIGDLGSASIAGVGLSIKYVSLFSVVMSAIVTSAGILIAQYKGNKDEKGVSSSFFCNLYLILGICMVFILASMIFPKQIMALYSDDAETIRQSAIYLRIIVWGFIPQAMALMMSTLLRNYDSAKEVMYASGLSVVTNTLGNYLLIYGIGVFPKLGIAGAAIATVFARCVELGVIFYMYFRLKKQTGFSLIFTVKFPEGFVSKIGWILAPILLSEFLWSLGDNVYAVIFGHLGTDACAAMTLTYPIQSLAIGALSGVAAASGIIVGESLGAKEEEHAYQDAKKILKLTVAVGIGLSIFIAIIANLYASVYHVSDDIQHTCVLILYAYCLVFCGKVINMVLGGGILRSGGQTKYTMLIVIGATWLVGVPFGLVSAYVFKWPIYLVYFALSLEEYVRVAFKLHLFKTRKWMMNLAEDGDDQNQGKNQNDMKLETAESC